MSTITREFTKEQLQQIIETDHVQCGEASALARIALASLEAEPVAEVCEGFTLRYIGHGPAPKSGVRVGDRLYTAPPAPFVPDEINVLQAANLVLTLGVLDNGIPTVAMKVWNACRAAMLQGGKS